VAILFESAERAVASTVDHKIAPLTAADSRRRSDLTSIQNSSSFRCHVSSFLAIPYDGGRAYVRYRASVRKR
jgi:hypothetical protein